MKGLSNGFYILVAIVSVLWSLLSTFEMEKTPDNSVRSGKKLTKISILELNSSMLSSSENRRKLRSLHKFTIKSESKIRKRGGSGTAFYLGNNFWVTARHVIDQCPMVYMANKGKNALIERIFLHPNSDLAIFRHVKENDTPFFNLNQGEIKDVFSSGFPGGSPGDIAVKFRGFAAIENKEYNIYEKGLVFTITRRDPYNLQSIGGLSGGPAYSKNNNLKGVLVAENVRRSLAIVVDMSSLRSLLLSVDSTLSSISRDKPLSYEVDENNFALVGKKIRDQSSIRQLFCVL